MVMRRAFVLGLVLGVVACAAPVRKQTALVESDEITLYRDASLIKQRVELEVPVAANATVKVLVPAGVTVEDLVILDRGPLVITELRSTSAPAEDEDAPSGFRMYDGGEDVLDEDRLESDDDPPPDEPEPQGKPAEVTFVVTAPKAGRYAVHLGYVTDRLDWEAAYTMTTTAARSRASLRGAVAIQNSTGVVFPSARVYMIDAELGAWRGRIAEQLGSALTGAPASTTPIATPRFLGKVSLGTGETRVELLPGEPPRRMRSVLVYDPIGTKLDHGGSAPIRDGTLGTEKVSTRVTESFEIERPESSSNGLPGGPVRLLERHRDGSLTVLGEARLFEASTRVAEEDTVAIGTADGVTGSRERREITIDDDGKRLVEEFVLTIKNTRTHPVEVVLREHLYRGQNWTLAYQTATEPKKEGPQQISLRTTVPAKSETKVLYVVVYTWP